MAAQDDQGWLNTGDLGYLTEQGHVVVCGRAKDVIIMAGRNIYPADVERAAGRVVGVRAGCVAAVRLDAGRSRESFAVAVESNDVDDAAQVRRIKHEVAHEVVTEVAARPRSVVVLAPGRFPRRRPASCVAVTRCPWSHERAPIASKSRWWGSVVGEPFRCPRCSTAMGAVNTQRQCDSSTRHATADERCRT